ncbi:hypothetical protein E1B28_011002 [Marasmius oreades]|uniref:DUF7918 domain-containing protein n=1 Tax=Marasmius oreades TaxID=181124 RepID=A0A9P7RTW3_9AGAR|nr:uncharacterized protein E1B28_011002 [Marasmius oreades]KAG7089305.1 hypothetical protein E1B28_011002 [Marasmius oreades]
MVALELIDSSSQEYEVNWKACALEDSVSARVRIDGHQCQTQLRRTAQAGFMRPIKGMRTGPTTRHRFTFSSVKTTDSDDIFLNSNSEVGEIWLTIQNTRITKTNVPVNPTSVPPEQIFHETTKKCINHQTSFRPTTTPQKTFTDGVDYGDPLAIFCFNYRPLGILQANGLAPPPTPQRSPKRSRSSKKPDAEDVKPKRSPTPTFNSRLLGSKRSRSCINSDTEDVKTKRSPTPTLNSRLLGSKRSRNNANPDAEDVKPQLDISEDKDDAMLRGLQNQTEAVRARQKANAQSSRKKIKREPVVAVTTIDLTLSD